MGVISAALITLCAGSAFAQLVPNGGIVNGQTWTTNQWNHAWGSKVDNVGGTIANGNITNPTITAGSWQGGVLVNPAFTGVVAVPTLSPGDNSTNAASTAFVTTAVASSGAGCTLNCNLTTPTITGGSISNVTTLSASGGTLTGLTHAGGVTSGTFSGNPVWTGNHTFQGSQMTVGPTTPGTFFLNPSSTNNLFIGMNATTQAKFRVTGIGGTILDMQADQDGITTLNNTLSLIPGGAANGASPGQHGIIMNNNWVGTGSNYVMNQLQADDAITGPGNVLVVGATIDHNTATGQKFAFLAQMGITGISGNGSAFPGGIYAAGGTGAVATVNDGGSAVGFGTQNKGSGSLFGWNPGATLHCASGNPAVQPCATGWAGVNSMEADMQTDANTSVNTRFGIVQGLSDAPGTQGVWEDAAIALGHVQNQASNSGWKQGLMFGIPQAGFPMDPLSTMIGAGPVTGGTMLAAYGVDWSLVTFSQAFLKSVGFLVDGVGNTDVKTIQITSALTVSTLPTCNSGTDGTFSKVTDATSPTYNGALTGGGTVHVPVYCNGTAWTSH